ncbi:MAG: transglutaminase family protein [Planctomycetes bacterium]|nr:transglutaminase family protein [Planctomycetota bacterium]
MQPRELKPDDAAPLPRASSVLAAISLLTDPDSAVVAACRAQLLRWGSEVRPHLMCAMDDGEPRLRHQARMMLRALDLQEWARSVERFAKSVPSQGAMSWEQLEAGAVLLSGLGRPDVVDAAELARTLDGFAAELRPRLANKSPVTCARLLAGYLSTQLGYGGSRSSFYEVGNVHFDRVVQVRRGVPVALTLLYLLVGRRAGLQVSGVAIPDHFLVRVHGLRPVLIDPYHEGRQVTKADCVRYLRIAGYGLHTKSYLEDVPDRQLLDCLLRDLLRVYGYREDHEVCSVLERTRQSLMHA